MRAGEDYGFLRQPFQAGAGGDPQALPLLCQSPVAAVKFPRRGGGEQGRGCTVHLNRDVQLIAAHHTARRVQYIYMAYLITFRIKRSLHSQRPDVPALMTNAACATSLETKMQARPPSVFILPLHLSRRV